MAESSRRNDKHHQKEIINLLVQAFNFFDRDGSGDISKEELSTLLKMDNPDITDEIIEYMIQEVDLNNDGNVSFEEFMKMMKVQDDAPTDGSPIMIQNQGSAGFERGSSPGGNSVSLGMTN